MTHKRPAGGLARCGRRLAVVSVVALIAAVAACADDRATPDVSRDTGVDVALDVEPWEANEPLAMPLQPTFDVDEFASATACAVCHPTHYDRWSQSMHAYAIHDPVFRALVGVRQAEFDGSQDRFCMQCHTAIGTRGGAVVPGFDFDELPAIVQEGITCEACHRVTAVERPYNSGHRIDPSAPMNGTLPDPAPSPYHESVTTDLLSQSRFCGACHDVVELNGLPLERPFQEWLQSPAADEGRNCQSCHMAQYDGQAATGGAERSGLHDHRFVGVDVPLSAAFRNDDRVADMRAEIAALLRTAATVELGGAAGVRPGAIYDVVVSVENEIGAHSLPTGSTFIRQLWLDLRVTDASGETLYATGTLDENGDLRDRWSALDPYGDADLIVFGSSFTDDAGTPVLFPWLALEHRSTAIPAGHRRTFTLFAPVPADAEGPLTVAAHLRFRTHPPFLLRALGLDDLIPNVETYEIASAERSVALEP